MDTLSSPGCFSSCEVFLDLLLNLDIVGGVVAAWEHGRELWFRPR